MAQPKQDGNAVKHKVYPNRAAADALAGAISGAVARFIIGPLDVLKIRFQVQLEPIMQAAVGSQQSVSKYTGVKQALKLILREEVPGILLTVPYTGVQFVTLQQCKQLVERHKDSGSFEAKLLSFGCGAVAGSAATLASYPFDLLRTTLAAQGEPKVYHNIAEAVRGIVQQKGIRGLYSGLSVTLMEIIPYAALQFGFYDAFTAAYANTRRQIDPKGPKKLQDAPEASVARFMCGLLAGTLAKLATHPLDVAKKRFQVAGLQRAAGYGASIPITVVDSLPKCIMQIYTREGLRGLYKGVSLSIVKAAPASAITLTVYEFLAIHFITYFHKEGRTAQQ